MTEIDLGEFLDLDQSLTFPKNCLASADVLKQSSSLTTVPWALFSWYLTSYLAESPSTYWALWETVSVEDELDLRTTETQFLPNSFTSWLICWIGNSRQSFTSNEQDFETTGELFWVLLINLGRNVLIAEGTVLDGISSSLFCSFSTQAELSILSSVSVTEELERSSA